MWLVLQVAPQVRARLRKDDPPESSQASQGQIFRLQLHALT